MKETKQIEIIIGVHLELPRGITTTLRKASKLCKPYENYTFDPHITLHIARVPRTNMNAMITAVKRIKLKSIKVQLGAVNVSTLAHNQNYLYLCQKIKKTSGLMNLHRELITAINPWRKGLIRSKDKDRLMQKDYFTVLEKKYVKKYGYSRVLRNFNPHITLGVLDAKEQRKAKTIMTSLATFNNYSFPVDHLIFGVYAYDTKRQRYIRSRANEKAITLTNKL